MNNLNNIKLYTLYLLILLNLKLNLKHKLIYKIFVESNKII